MPKRESYENNTWLRATTSRTVIVFVHGILSKTDTCWRRKRFRKDHVFWPKLVADDTQFEHASVFLGGYAASWSTWNFSVADAARQLRNALKVTKPQQQYSGAQTGREPVKGGDVPFKRDRYLFICHSLGGLIVRRMLIDFWNEFQGKKIGVILCGSPTAGSPFAIAAWPVAALLGHKLGRVLRPGDSELVSLDQSFRKLLRENKPEVLDGIELIETQSMLLSLPYFRLVPSDSATRYFPGQHIGGVSHSTLVKPLATSASQHQSILAFALSNGFLTAEKCQTAISQLSAAIDELLKRYQPQALASPQMRSEARRAIRESAGLALDLADTTDRFQAVPEMKALADNITSDDLKEPFPGIELKTLAAIQQRLNTVFQ